MTKPAPAYRLNRTRFTDELESRGMTRSQFLEASGLPERTLERMLAGKNEVTMPNVARVRAALPELGFDDLFRRADLTRSADGDPEAA